MPVAAASSMGSVTVVILCLAAAGAVRALQPLQLATSTGPSKYATSVVRTSAFQERM
jgi:hypothetical protein